MGAKGIVRDVLLESEAGGAKWILLEAELEAANKSLEIAMDSINEYCKLESSPSSAAEWFHNNLSERVAVSIEALFQREPK